MTGYRSIAAGVDRDVLRITLRRSPLNVLDQGMLREVNAALEAAAGIPSLRAVVLAGEGKAFCAGVDIADHLPDRVQETLSLFHEVFRRLERLGAPAVARVHGPALGGGLELVAACDWAFATPEANLGVPEIRLGVFPPVAMALLPALVGYRAAADLVLTGGTVDGTEAARIGLVSAAVPLERLDERIDALLEELRARSAHALRSARRTLRSLVGAGWRGAIDEAERAYHAELSESPDAVEGMKAFLEKRKPVWADR